MTPSRSSTARPFTAAGRLVAVGLALAACRDAVPLAVAPAPTPAPRALAAVVQCVVTGGTAPTATCGTVEAAVAATPAAATERVRSAVHSRDGVGPMSVRTVGGQNQYVRLSVVGATYDQATSRYTVGLALQNLLQQPMGTTGDPRVEDPNGTIVFHVSDPVGVGGTPTVVSPDTTGNFDTFLNRPGMRYRGVIPPNVTTDARPFTLNWPAGTTSAQLQLLVITSLPDETAAGLVQGARWATVGTTSTGTAHRCLVREGGQIYCGAGNRNALERGALGTGRLDMSPEPLPSWAGAQGSQVVTLGIDAGPGSGGTLCALSGGRVLCVGDSSQGQLGDGRVREAHEFTFDPVVALIPASAGTVTVLSGSNGASCAVTSAAQLWCWGNVGSANQRGRLGDGRQVSTAVPQRVGAGISWLTVDVGWSHACGLDTDRRAYCWGNNSSGQLGDGTATTRLTPVAVTMPANDPSFASISAGLFTTCAVGGVTATGYCWGSNNNSGLSTVATTANVLVPSPVVSSSFPTWRRIVAGVRYQCGIASDDRVACWGDLNITGAQGTGIAGASLTPTAVFNNLRASQLAVAKANNTNGFVTCAIEVGTNHPWCWGNNDRYVLGLGGNGTFNVPALAPQRVNPDDQYRVTDISTDGAFTCVVRLAGDVECWGGWLQPTRVRSGAASSRELALIGALGVAGAEQVVMTTFATCALTGGRVFCWGSNTRGMLGQGGTGVTDLAYPAEVTLPRPAQQLVMGGNSVCALLDDGSPWCWGDNGSGQLGRAANTTANTTPQRAGDTETFVQLAMGSGFTCGLRTGGTAVACWGFNSNGQLGDGTTTTRSTLATNVSGLTGPILQIVAGGNAACALDGTGVARCWGQNISGALGVTPTGNVTSAQPVLQGALQFTRLARDFSAMCGLTAAGEAFCWGQNTVGQLGTGGTSTTPQTPGSRAAAAVGVISDVWPVGAGFCSRQASTGDIWCWGQGPWSESVTGNAPDPVRVVVPR